MLQQWGVIEVTQFNYVPRNLPFNNPRCYGNENLLCCYGNQVTVVEQKIGSSSAMWKNTSQNLVPSTLFQGHFMSETFGTMTTFLAMVKFWDSTSNSKIINKTANIIYKNCNILF